MLAGFIAYSFQPKKSSIKMTRFDKQALMQICGYLDESGFAHSLP
ncbi:hypothetical protein BTN49_0001 [Candidatus Enterovibrio escicola]|uniref:Uncharacterized protein n=1 Tax=Candidatus Enterovibrio escicola TaxID=1927127 RepID=A0A2A5T7Z5_9GAMM|nr:hypothetical protein BTN49_0001 [Candidatus Enterovibrio escacola]